MSGKYLRPRRSSTTGVLIGNYQRAQSPPKADRLDWLQLADERPVHPLVGTQPVAVIRNPGKLPLAEAKADGRGAKSTSGSVVAAPEFRHVLVYTCARGGRPVTGGDFVLPWPCVHPSSRN